MQMTNDEIVREYREAANKRAQIRILAQLNACPVETITDILTGAGEDIPKKTGPKPKVLEVAQPKMEKKAYTIPAVVADTLRVKIIELESLNNRLIEQAKGIKDQVRENDEMIRELTEFLERGTDEQ